MDISLAIMCLCIGAAVGALIVVGWKSDGKPLLDQLDDHHHSDESIEQRSRRVM